MILLSATFCTALYISPHCIIFWGAAFPKIKTLRWSRDQNLNTCLYVNRNEWDSTALSTSNKLEFLGAEIKGHYVVSDA